MKKGKIAILSIVVVLVWPMLLGASAVESSPTSGDAFEITEAASVSSGVDSSSSATSTSSAEVFRPKILGYAITTLSGEPMPRVVKDDNVLLKIDIHDSRVDNAEVASYPTVVCNSSSFITNMTAKKSGDAELENHLTPDKYTLVFNLKYTGSGNTFSFDLSYMSNTNAPPMETMTLKLNQCVEYIAPPDPVSEPLFEPESEPTIKGTGFSIVGIDYGKQAVSVGSTFPLTVDIQITSGDYNVENISATLKLPQSITLQDSSNLQFVGNVAPKGTFQVSFGLLVNAFAETGNATINLSLHGVSAEDGSSIDTDVEIYVPTVQPDRFEIHSVSIPSILNSSYDDGNGFCSIVLINKGIDPIRNATVSLSGTSLENKSGDVFVGTVDSGAQKTVDFYLIAEKEGSHQGEILVSYETAMGEQKQLSHEFSVVAENLGTGLKDGTLAIGEDSLQDEKSIPIWGWIIGAIGIILAIALIIRARRKREEWRRLEFDIPVEGKNETD